MELEQVWPGAVWTQVADEDTRDTVWQHAFEDGSGGLIAYRKPAGALVVTLGTAEGHARKLRMLEPTQFRWVGQPAPSDEQTVVLAVATEADTRRHRGTGLLDWRAVPPERCFRIDRFASVNGEAAPEVIPLLLPPGEKAGQWRLSLLRSHTGGESTHLTLSVGTRDPAFEWSAGFGAFPAGPGLHVCPVLLERADERRGVFLKQWTGEGLRLVGRAELAAAPWPGGARELSAELLEPLREGEPLGWGDLAVLPAVPLLPPEHPLRRCASLFALDLSPLPDPGPPFAALLACRAARLLLLCLARRPRGADRGAFGVLPAAVIREVARRVEWAWEWGGRAGQWAAFAGQLPTLRLLHSLRLDWQRRLPLRARTLRERLAAALVQDTDEPPLSRALAALFGNALLDAREALAAAVAFRRRRAAEQLRITIAQLESSIRQCFES